MLALQGLLILAEDLVAMIIVQTSCICPDQSQKRLGAASVHNWPRNKTGSNTIQCVAHAPLMLMLLTLLLTLLMEGSVVAVGGTTGAGDCTTTGGFGEPASQQKTAAHACQHDKICLSAGSWKVCVATLHFPMGIWSA
jgi:hypothetical protein